MLRGLLYSINVNQNLNDAAPDTYTYLNYARTSALIVSACIGLSLEMAPWIYEEIDSSFQRRAVFTGWSAGNVVIALWLKFVNDHTIATGFYDLEDVSFLHMLFGMPLLGLGAAIGGSIGYQMYQFCNEAEPPLNVAVTPYYTQKNKMLSELRNVFLTKPLLIEQHGTRNRQEQLSLV